MLSCCAIFVVMRFFALRVFCTMGSFLLIYAVASIQYRRVDPLFSCLNGFVLPFPSVYRWAYFTPSEQLYRLNNFELCQMLSDKNHHIGVCSVCKGIEQKRYTCVSHMIHPVKCPKTPVYGCFGAFPYRHTGYIVSMVSLLKWIPVKRFFLPYFVVLGPFGAVLACLCCSVLYHG